MKRNRMIILILYISLFASVTNFIPLSVSYCLLVLLVPVICSKIPVKSVFGHCYACISFLLFPHWFTIPSHSWIIPFTEETGIFSLHFSHC